MSALAKFLGFWLLGAALLGLAGCSASTDDEPENVGSVSQATTTCLTAALPGECRYLPSVASASSVESSNPSLGADMAIDSSCSTRWSSAFSDPQWLKLDLGSSRPLSRVVIHWDNAASSAYELQVSNDGSAWTKVATNAKAVIAGSGSSRVDTISSLTATARYVRLYSTKRTTTFGNSIAELEVFGTGCGAPTSCSWIPTVLTAAAASSKETTEKGPEKAIDGLMSTRWSSAFSDPQWLRIDLGQSTSIGRVVLDWENASSAKYDLQVSESTSGPWTTIFSHTDARTGPRTDDLTALSGKGRYLRINSTKRTTAYGVALYEVQIFRQSCETCEQVLPSTKTQASSVESTGSAYAATNATDGDYTTRWSSKFQDPQWLSMDLGATRRIKQVIIKWEASASKSYRLEWASAAAGPWQVLAQRSNQPAGPRVDILKDFAVSARYLRVYSTARTSSYGNSIYEIIALGGANPLACDFACPGGATLDTDGDGTPNCLDACPKDPLKTKPGKCDCGSPDIDTDHDGILDCFDRPCENDPTNAACPSDDALGERVPAPGPFSTVVPVNQATCNPPTALPAALPTPGEPTTDDSLKRHYTGAQLAAHFDQAIHASTTVGGACTAVQEIAQCELDQTTATNVECDLDLDGNPIHSMCAGLGPNYRCGYLFPPLGSCPNTEAPDLCKIASLRCGLPAPDCLELEKRPTGCEGDNTRCCNLNATAAECPCDDVELCSDPRSTGNSGPTDPTSYLPQTPKAVAPAIVGAKQPAPPPVYTDPPEGDCQRRGHEPWCWCTLGMDDPAEVADVGETTATHGSGSIVSLQFKPNTTFDVDLNPLPFGEANYVINASANFVATVGVDLPIIGARSLDLLDVAAGVHADRCSANTNDAHFKFLRQDFTDLAGSEPFTTSGGSDASPNQEALGEASSACSTAVDGFITAADRAKKALKDVQTLLKHYNQLGSTQTWTRTDDTLPSGQEAFCELVDEADDDFPAGDCENDPIEVTINRFIDYYATRVVKLTEAMVDVPLKTQAMFDALKIVKPAEIKFLDFHREASANLATVQFFVGPIPVNITVDIAANYGIDGTFEYGFSPFNRFGLQPGDSARIIGAAGKLIPSAGASLAVFAGVGFDVPGFAVKAGIEGRLVLAEIQANLEAGAGLSVRVKDDLRVPPTDEYSAATVAIDAHQLYFRPTQAEYFVDWFYGGTLAIPKVLEGTINAKLKLKAFIFSKTWKKTFLTFGPAFKLDPGVRLFEGGGQFGAVTEPTFNTNNSLGDFEMQLPFPMLNRVGPRSGVTTEVPYQAAPQEAPLHFDGVCHTKVVIPA